MTYHFTSLDKIIVFNQKLYIQITKYNSKLLDPVNNTRTLLDPDNKRRGAGLLAAAGSGASDRVRSKTGARRAQFGKNGTEQLL